MTFFVSTREGESEAGWINKGKQTDRHTSHPKPFIALCAPLRFLFSLAPLVSLFSAAFFFFAEGAKPIILFFGRGG